MKPKFKDRYVLATGIPLLDDYSMGIWKNEDANKRLHFPMLFVNTVIDDIPRYRLVLERVKPKRGKA